MGRPFELVVSDGIAFAHAGDTAVIVYAADARLERTKWLYDQVDHLTARMAPANGLLIVLPSSAVPDAETRAENTHRMRRLRGRLRRVVTVILGDGLRISLARSIMRAMFLLHGQARVQSIVCSVDEGIALLLSEPTERMPERAQIDAVLREICDQLSCTL
jgi:hypothetical protein